MSKICPNCSNQIEDEAIFCGHCGATYTTGGKEILISSQDYDPNEQVVPPDDHNPPPDPPKEEEMGFYQLYFSPKGRIGLSTFWKKGIFPQLIFLLLASIGIQSNSALLNVIGLLIVIPVMISIPMLVVKRVHDFNVSGRSYYFNPFKQLSMGMGLAIYLSKGDRGPNDYGEKSH